jgi:hypothetical protein
MYEILIERPRGGLRGRREKGRPPRDPDLLPRFESSSRNRGGTKWLSENLKPMERFLEKRLGRPWNDVHSEIAAHLRIDSAVQKHVMDHLRQMVEVNAILVDGCVRDWNGSELRRTQFYVCPRTAQLRRPPQAKDWLWNGRP